MSHKCEVVHVLTRDSLIDSESYEHRYQAQHMMTPRFYVVVWPTSGSRRFDRQARFIGPYAGRADAESSSLIRGGTNDRTVSAPSNDHGFAA